MRDMGGGGSPRSSIRLEKDRGRAIERQERGLAEARGLLEGHQLSAHEVDSVLMRSCAPH